jgi:hypothetical protein
MPQKTQVYTPVVTPSTCPKFHTCNAPICPLDKEWVKRVNQVHDPVCYYLIESVKEGSPVNFERALLGELYQVIVRVRGDISKHFKRIKKKLDAAAKTTSRMERKFKTIKEVV